MSIRYMTLSEIQNFVTESVDFDWMDTPGDWELMIRTKAKDTGFGHLVESIMTHGLLEESTVVIDEFGTIIEGHHRLVAAILLCLDVVPVSTEEQWNHAAPYLSAHYSDDEYPIELVD